VHRVLWVLVTVTFIINPLNDKLNPICHLLALLGAHHIFHISWTRVKSKSLRMLKFYITQFKNHKPV